MKRIVFLLSLIFFASPANLAAVDFNLISQKLKNNIRKVTLDNGLRLVMMQYGKSPTASLYIKFRVGAVDEAPEEAGTAHLLEHMLFKGTENVGTRNYEKEKKYLDQIEVYGRRLDEMNLAAREYQLSGAPVPPGLASDIEKTSKRLDSLHAMHREFVVKSEDSWIYDQNGQTGFNAYTNQDVTNYQIQLPVNRMEVWAKLESDRLKKPVLREFYTERDVVREERRMRVDNVGTSLLREKFLDAAFGEHPYRKPVIGYESVIPFLDLKETENFFYNHYTPDNMVIAIVGQIDFDKTEKLIKRYFASIKRKSDRKPVRRFEKFNTGYKKTVFRHPSGAVVLMGWKKPGLGHPDNIPFDLLGHIMSDGPTSRLYKRLVIQEKLALSVSAWNGDPGERYNNLFTVYVKLASGASHARVEEIVNEEFEKVKSGDLKKTEIDSVKKRIFADFFHGIDSTSTLADVLSYYELLTGKWETLFELYDKMTSLDKKDVEKAAAVYINNENLVVGNLETTVNR